MNRPGVHQSVPSRTAPQLKAEFERRGVSIADWARANGFSPALVYQILAGRKRCVRGKSHQIAVALGLKQGLIGSVSDIALLLGSEPPAEQTPSCPGMNAASEGGATS